MNYTNFISKEKSLLIAPAGFGKSYFFANCLQQTPDDKRQLILTHTHAGIASIKEKISKTLIGKYTGINSPVSKQVMINGIKFVSLTEAAKFYNIS